jgi:hypothetical protein
VRCVQVKVAKDKAGAALHHMKENLGHGMTAAVKAVKAVNKGKGKADLDAMHPALATPVGDRARSRLMYVDLIRTESVANPYASKEGATAVAPGQFTRES